MTFKEVIENNRKIADVSWWPCYAYHYTDISNAVKILSTGILYSRIKAHDSRLMKNDNASIKVINMTNVDTKSYVRFYFRPKTPTQYHNEGYKHSSIRYCGDENANVPVPVFFVFDMSRLIQEQDIEFSELSQAGSGSERLKGIEAFSTLKFDKIYSNGAVSKEVMKYRHAEILYPDSYYIAKSIRKIVCRNEIEKMTLLNMLKQENFSQYERYKQQVCVYKQDMFEENGLFVKDISYGYDAISFYFSDTHSKLKYFQKYHMENDERDLNVNITIQLTWKDCNQKDIDAKTIDWVINYINPEPITLNHLPIYNNASLLVIEIYIDNNCMCKVERDLSELILL